MAIEAGQTVRVIDVAGLRKVKSGALAQDAVHQVHSVTPLGNVRLKGVFGLFKPHRFAAA